MTTQVQGKRYIRLADTAKMLRAALKREFPGQKFSVRSHSYSGGASIYVRWTDGPPVHAVENVTRLFEGARFDGMIDLQYGASHWLAPDGTLTLAETYGHGMGMDGVHAAPTEGAELVSLGSDYVMTSRDISPAYREVLKAAGQEALNRAVGFEGYTMDDASFGGQQVIPTRFGGGSCLPAYDPEMLMRALSRYVAPDGTDFEGADQ